MKWLLFILSVSLFAAQLPGYVHDDSVAAGGYGTSRVDLNDQSVTSGLNNITESAGSHTSALPGDKHSEKSIPTRELTLQQYITPDDEAVKVLAGGLKELKDIYDTASGWIYISDEGLNQAADKWLTPHEFLIDSPGYPANPLQGNAVSDCEEKANTMVSLIRASGIAPEKVRVVLGEVSFNNVKTGHAWVEVFNDGNWLSLDPSWGPYWNEKTFKLVNRKAVPFDYYTGHQYPVIQVWTYYNDIYYFDPRNNAGIFPDSWSLNPAT